MHYHLSTKSLAHRLSIAGRAALALALAIGASGAIFSTGGMRPLPFLCADAQIQTTDKADSTDSATPFDEQDDNESSSQHEARKSDHSGNARSKRAMGRILLTNHFITSKLLRDNYSQGKSASMARQQGF